MSFGHDFFSYDSIFTSNAESAVFNATDFDIEPSDSQKAGQYVEMKAIVVDNVEKYHYKLPTKNVFENGELITIPNDSGSFLNSGLESADEIKNWAIVKPFLDKGYGLKFLRLTSADEGDSNGTPVQGCMDETATNYDPDATEDDSSCKYEENDETGEEDMNPLFLVAGAVLLVLIMK